jgi:hypothetical protein
VLHRKRGLPGLLKYRNLDLSGIVSLTQGRTHRGRYISRGVEICIALCIFCLLSLIPRQLYRAEITSRQLFWGGNSRGSVRSWREQPGAAACRFPRGPLMARDRSPHLGAGLRWPYTASGQPDCRDVVPPLRHQASWEMGHFGKLQYNIHILFIRFSKTKKKKKIRISITVRVCVS